MDSTATHLLTTLVVFRNTVRAEVVRSVHVYRLRNGEHSEVGREFWFSPMDLYVEMLVHPVLKSKYCRVTKVSEGYKNGVWRCIFAFHADKEPQFSYIPPLLLVRRNHKLQTIPTLFDDLHMINKLECQSAVLDQDLNCCPYADGMSECDKKLAEESLPGSVLVLSII